MLLNEFLTPLMAVFRVKAGADGELDEYGAMDPMGAKHIDTPAATLVAREVEGLMFLTHSPRIHNNSVPHLPVRAKGMVPHGVATHSSTRHTPVFASSRNTQWMRRLFELAAKQQDDPVENAPGEQVNALSKHQQRAWNLYQEMEKKVSSVLGASVPDDLTLLLSHKQLILPVVIDGVHVDILVSPLPSIPVGSSILARRKIHETFKKDKDKEQISSEDMEQAPLPYLLGRTLPYYMYNQKWANTGLASDAKMAYLVHTPMTSERKADYRAAYGQTLLPKGSSRTTIKSLILGDLVKAIGGLRKLSQDRLIDVNNKCSSRLSVATTATAFAFYGHIKKLRGAFKVDDIKSGDQIVKDFIMGELINTDEWVEFVSQAFLALVLDEICRQKVAGPRRIDSLSDLEVGMIKNFSKGAALAYDWH